MEKVKDLSKVVIPVDHVMVQDITDEGTDKKIILLDGSDAKKEGFKGKVVAVNSSIKDIEVGDLVFLFDARMFLPFESKSKKCIISHRNNFYAFVKPNNLD